MPCSELQESSLQHMNVSVALGLRDGQPTTSPRCSLLANSQVPAGDVPPGDVGTAGGSRGDSCRFGRLRFGVSAPVGPPVPPRDVALAGAL